jgi:hypothetical protein
MPMPQGPSPYEQYENFKKFMAMQVQQDDSKPMKDYNEYYDETYGQDENYGYETYEEHESAAEEKFIPEMQTGVAKPTLQTPSNPPSTTQSLPPPAVKKATKGRGKKKVETISVATAEDDNDQKRTTRSM